MIDRSKVIAVGTTKEVALSDLLTRPKTTFKDPLLTTRGLKLNFRYGGNEVDLPLAVEKATLD